MLEILLPALVTCAWTAIALNVGAALQRRYDRRRNAATAQCMACEWTSGPVPLGDAFRLAEGHTAAPCEPYARTMVVRA